MTKSSRSTARSASPRESTFGSPPSIVTRSNRGARGPELLGRSRWRCPTMLGSLGELRERGALPPPRRNACAIHREPRQLARKTPISGTDPSHEAIRGAKCGPGPVDVAIGRVDPHGVRSMRKRPGFRPARRRAWPGPAQERTDRRAEPGRAAVADPRRRAARTGGAPEAADVGPDREWERRRGSPPRVRAVSCTWYCGAAATRWGGYGPETSRAWRDQRIGAATEPAASSWTPRPSLDYG